MKSDDVMGENQKDPRKGTVLECELHLLETLPTEYVQRYDRDLGKHVYTDKVLWVPYKVIYRQKRKGKDLVKVAQVMRTTHAFNGPYVTTTYDPVTGKWWGHEPKLEELIKSGKWKDLPVLDTSDWLSS